MHSCRLAGGWRLALGTTLLLTGMAAGGDRAASGPFPPWPRAKGPIEVGSGAMQPIAPPAMVRVTRAPRWSSEDLADFICYGVEDEPLRSLMVWGRSGATEHPQKGAGVVVNAEAHIITTETLVGCEATAQVQFADGRAVVARVVGRNPLLNGALLEVKAAGGPIPAARLGDAAGLAPGSEVAVPVWDGNDAPVAICAGERYSGWAACPTQGCSPRKSRPTFQPTRSKSVPRCLIRSGESWALSSRRCRLPRALPVQCRWTRFKRCSLISRASAGFRGAGRG